MAWSTVVLATDADLSSYEPDMPDVAMKPGLSGQAPYTGKRALAKRDIEQALRRRGMDPDGVQTPSQLTHAAVCLELAYIYRALARLNESVETEKAEYYQSRYDTEIESVALDYVDPGAAETPTRRMTINLARG